MATATEKMTADGRVYYEIRVSQGRGKPKASKRWYPEKGWSKRYIERMLEKAKAEFEREVRSGEAITRAERKERDLQRKREAAKVQTLRQYVESVYMPTVTLTLSENTRNTYQSVLDRWILPALGELRLPDITAANISALLLSMQRAGKAHATCVKVYNVLMGLFKKAYMTDVVDRNPMDKVQRPIHRKDEVKREEPEAYTAEEMRHILQCLEHEPLKWQVYMRLLADTGMRKGECCGLQWKDVNFRDDTITISGNLCYTQQKGVYLDTPKNGKTRTVDIDPEIMALLQQLRTEQARHGISSYVFTQNNSSSPMHPRTPGFYMKKFGKRYGVEHLHPHKLRHTFASIAITCGADVASVSEKLGHSDKSMTLRMYTHADKESIRRTSQIFRDAIKKAAT